MDDGCPMEATITYEADAGIEDDSSSQGALMTTDKTELELRPRGNLSNRNPLFDPARSLNLSNLVLTTSDGTTVRDRMEGSASSTSSPAHDLQTHMMDHNYSSGDGPSTSNKRKSSPEDNTQKKSRLDFSEIPCCSSSSFIAASYPEQRGSPAAYQQAPAAALARIAICDDGEEQSDRYEEDGEEGIDEEESETERVIRWKRLQMEDMSRRAAIAAGLQPHPQGARRPPTQAEMVAAAAVAAGIRPPPGSGPNNPDPAARQEQMFAVMTSRLMSEQGLFEHYLGVARKDMEDRAMRRAQFDGDMDEEESEEDRYKEYVLTHADSLIQQVPHSTKQINVTLAMRSYSNRGISSSYRVDSYVKEVLDKQAMLDKREEEEVEIREISDEEKGWIEQFQKMSVSSQRGVLSHLVDSACDDVVRFLSRVIEPHFQRDFISSLPAELALKILSMMTPEELCKNAVVSKRWAMLSLDDNLWKKRNALEAIDWNGAAAPTSRVNGLWESQPGHASVRSVNVPGMMDLNSLIEHRIERMVPYGGMWEKSPHKALFLRMARIKANWKTRGIAGTCIFKGHDDHVITCLQLQNDMIVTGSDDNTLKVWSINEPVGRSSFPHDEKTHLRHTLVGHSGGVWTSQVSSCGKYIVSGSTDRTVRVWCARSGRQLHCLQGHTSTVRCMALHGRVLVSGSRDTTLRMWDIETGNSLRQLVGHVAAVRCVQFNGKKVASGAYDFTVKIWEASTGACLHTLQGHTNRVYSLLMDTEKDVVVSGSLDTTIRVWNMTSGACIANLMGHTSLTSGMQLKGDILVSCNADSYIRVWNINHGQCIHRLGGSPHGHASAITSLQFLDNALVVTSSDDGSVKLWDVAKGCFVRDLVRLTSGGNGGCIWRLKATDTLLVCAVGSRNGTEDTKLILLDFDASYP